jgi:hypothetical protein
MKACWSCRFVIDAFLNIPKVVHVRCEVGDNDDVTEVETFFIITL